VVVVVCLCVGGGGGDMPHRVFSRSTIDAGPKTLCRLNTREHRKGCCLGVSGSPSSEPPGPHQLQIPPPNLQLAPLHVPEVGAELVSEVRHAQAVLKAVVAGLQGRGGQGMGTTGWAAASRARLPPA
jgi:hypothetical protein